MIQRSFQFKRHSEIFNSYEECKEFINSFDASELKDGELYLFRYKSYSNGIVVNMRPSQSTIQGEYIKWVDSNNNDIVLDEGQKFTLVTTNGQPTESFIATSDVEYARGNQWARLAESEFIAPKVMSVFGMGSMNETYTLGYRIGLPKNEVILCVVTDIDGTKVLSELDTYKGEIDGGEF